MINKFIKFPSWFDFLNQKNILSLNNYLESSNKVFSLFQNNVFTTKNFVFVEIYNLLELNLFKLNFPKLIVSKFKFKKFFKKNLNKSSVNLNKHSFFYTSLNEQNGQSETNEIFQQSLLFPFWELKEGNSLNNTRNKCNLKFPKTSHFRMNVLETQSSPQTSCFKVNIYSSTHPDTRFDNYIKKSVFLHYNCLDVSLHTSKYNNLFICENPKNLILNLQKNFSYSNKSFNRESNSNFPEIDRFKIKNANFVSNKNLNRAKTKVSNAKITDVSKQQVVSITYEEIGLFPRSFNRVFDRFFKQIFFDVENLVIQEYRFYRYLFLTTVKCVFILIFVPSVVNFLAKNYLVRPITEYYWNSSQSEIFLNSYQQKRAFNELQEFEEKIYFESFLFSDTNFFSSQTKKTEIDLAENTVTSKIKDNFYTFVSEQNLDISVSKQVPETSRLRTNIQLDESSENSQVFTKKKQIVDFLDTNVSKQILETSRFKANARLENVSFLNNSVAETRSSQNYILDTSVSKQVPETHRLRTKVPPSSNLENRTQTYLDKSLDAKLVSQQMSLPSFSTGNIISKTPEKDAIIMDSNKLVLDERNTIRSNISETSVSEQTNQNSIQKRLQIKTLELAKHYNSESIEAITNFFADLISFTTLCYLLFKLEIQINITKSFLLEVFFGLDDSKKSLLILFITDLLVGYHSPNIWELLFSSFFDHYGLPESQTTIFLLVATLPVLLDVLFKYLIFRHLNRASPATVATYHAMIE